MSESVDVSKVTGIRDDLLERLVDTARNSESYQQLERLAGAITVALESNQTSEWFRENRFYQVIRDDDGPAGALSRSSPRDEEQTLLAFTPREIWAFKKGVEAGEFDELFRDVQEPQ